MIDLLEHNQETYERIKEIFNKHNRCGVVQPTGTGKSYLMIKLIEDYIGLDRDIIIVEPQRYIFDQLKKIDGQVLSNKNIKFLTYSMLGKMNDDKMEQFNSPILVLVDEMHRAGAVKWGKGLQMMFDKFPVDCKYIGLSATPIRYLDGKRNMVEEFFDGNYACNMMLSDAIIKRILPLPRYIVGLYTYDNEFNSLTRKIEQSCNSEREKAELMEELTAMKKNLDKSKGVSSILKKYILSDKGKYVAFCNNIEHLNEMLPCLKNWFDEAGIKANFYVVHSENPQKDAQFKAFKEDEGLAVCLSVNMLGEGLHNIDAVILLRNTISPNLHYQQIGRAFAVGMDSVPLIFDLVANCNSIIHCGLKANLLESVEKRERERKCQDKGESKEISKEDIENFFVFDQVIEALSTFRNIEERLKGEWDVYIEALEKFKASEGDLLVPKGHTEILDGRKVSLGAWVSRIRKERNGIGDYQLASERIDQLNELGFIWDATEYQFKRNVNDCITFYEENGKKPSWNSKEEKERSLSIFWGYNTNKTKLPQWQRDLLQQIPTFFDEKLSAYDKFYERVLKFKEINGHVNIKYRDVIDGYNIGQAFQNLRNNYKNGELTDKQVKGLKNIGIDITVGKFGHEFNRKMELAKQAMSEGVVLRSQNGKYKGVNLYGWIKKNKDKFTDEELKIIDKLIPNIKKPVEIKDIQKDKVYTFLSISDAGRALHNEFHLVNTDSGGKTIVANRLYGRVKDPVYKGLIFQYAEPTTKSG